MTQERLDQRAHEILIRNDRGGYTVPNGRVYPFQWNWDSAFVSLGFAAVDLDRAWREIESLFEGQWGEGFLPHIIFRQDDEGYFPGPAIWATGHTPPTSGITQPPFVASAIHSLWQTGDPQQYRDRLALLFPKILAWHRWFVRVRDPLGKGLALIVHPWESGRDNSTEWDAPSQKVDASQVGPYQRRDTNHLDARLRPAQIDYDRYYALLQFGRSLGWNQSRIALESPFRMVDVGMTMILLRANRDLRALALVLNETDVAEELCRNIRIAEQGVDWLWNEEAGAYCSRDVISERSSNCITSASFLSFYAGVRDEHRDRRLIENLERISDNVKYLLPSLDPREARFDSLCYWRGPVWAVINFLVGTGLSEAGHGGWAERIRSDTRELIELMGMYEYFCPLTGRGIGGDDFSWTAAMWLHWARGGARQ